MVEVHAVAADVEAQCRVAQLAVPVWLPLALLVATIVVVYVAVVALVLAEVLAVAAHLTTLPRLAIAVPAAFRGAVW